jgi:UDP-4-amino-4,6-dideoxy-N-acetyl-beta-L-altrosamine transaminase
MNSIPYGRQEITDEDIAAVIQVLRSDFLTQGPKVKEFEVAFADYVGAKYAVAVTNGTAALHLSALALDVNEKSRVIATPITFAASSNCVLYCGGKVEFADIDPVTALIDIDHVRRMIDSKPRGYYQGIIPVDFAGCPVDMEKLGKIAEENDLWIIQDSCHAPGAYFTDSMGSKQYCGNNAYSDVTVFSFHPVKHIATGEGGMITTNDEQLYQKLLKLRTHGITREPQNLKKNDGGWYYEMQLLGLNYRISDILCALGLSQLAKADERLKRRIEIAQQYDEAFRNHPRIHLLEQNVSLVQRGVQHAYHLYVIKTDKRLDLFNKLREANIFTQVHYIPVYTMPYYRSNGHNTTKCPEAEKYYQSCLSLPMYPSLTDDQQYHVIQSILKSFN